MKVLVEIYCTYGKHDGDTLIESFVIDDTKAERELLINDYEGDYACNSEEDFINGKINNIAYDLYGGDWDDPTGREIVIISYESKYAELEQKFKKDIENLNKKFNIVY